MGDVRDSESMLDNEDKLVRPDSDEMLDMSDSDSLLETGKGNSIEVSRRCLKLLNQLDGVDQSFKRTRLATQWRE